MMALDSKLGKICLSVLITALQIPIGLTAELDLTTVPLFLSQQQPPLNLLVMGRDHKLYNEAYNDASDLNNDGVLDVGYKPDVITYFGYFDSFKCYSYGSGLFSPTGVTLTKKCNGAWSGDFLNYLTTARIDALRAVLYGGKRSTDSTSQTVLERTHIPQDAHSWGKEYHSIAVDGYDIREYSPLALPLENTRHLFANTTPMTTTDWTTNNGPPLLRVLVNSNYRIWEWVSIESPVAGDRCLHGASGPNCVTTGSTIWEIVPAEFFQNLTQTTYLNTGSAHPNNHAEFDLLVASATLNIPYGSGPVSTINGSDNPFGPDDMFVTLFSGQIVIPQTGNYTFAVDGDDAVELIIDGTVVASWYGGHGNCNCTSHSGSINLTAGTHNLVFRHEERFGGANYFLRWQRTLPSSTRTDYEVKVEVCNAAIGLEPNCQAYGDPPIYKPTGLLQDFGEDGSMLFGLMTGTYDKNRSGGILRRNVDSIEDEIDPATGQFLNPGGVPGVIGTIDRLRMTDYRNYRTGLPSLGAQYYCGLVTNRPINDGECRMWGNPIGEMIYEGARYFAGKAAATSSFDIASTGNQDATLGLPEASWIDPYGAGNNKWCAKPFQTVISDINPSYDTDQVPGTSFGSFSGDLSGFNASTIANTIWSNEFGSSMDVFIGESAGVSDGAPTAKSVSSFANIRGLSPEEPTKQGGYYAASAAYYGLTTDLNPIDGGVNDSGQKMTTFAVALASPLPRIEIPVNNGTITLVPFGKSVGGCCGATPNQGSYQATNQIVDFYVEELTPTSGRFQVNFEDVEAGNDHDMDAIVRYTYQVNVDNTVTISLSSDYAAGGIIQHMGYVISGTTADGIYLDVRDQDTAAGSDPDYFLDTPPNQPPGGVWNDSTALPLTASRTFTPGNSSGATLLEDPLWYAAKWGGFQEQAESANDLPDQAEEWDSDGDGVPDNYFLVTNALRLKDQLTNAFLSILERTASASSASLNSGNISSETRVYQARFNSASWFGELLSFPVNADGTLGSQPEWDAGDDSIMPVHSSREIITIDGSGAGIPFRWDTNVLSASQQLALNTDINGMVDNLGNLRVDYLRGDAAEERRNNGNFRDRAVREGATGVDPKRLGDIVNSDPVFVGKPTLFYPDLWPSGSPENSGQTYSQFRTANFSRQSLVYVGANDGMLHGFDAATGIEQIAYVPNEVFANLSMLTSPNYNHQYYVDGPASANDVFYNTQWHTVLAGGLNGGGQAIYALDITDPSNFSEPNAASIVLWEFSDADDADLGFTFSQPQIVRLANGRWAAVFGNGYNSTASDGAVGSGHAVLYVVDIEDGTLISKIDTLAGSLANPNGLATVLPVDLDGDFIVEFIYAGDLFGNLWKFDMRSSNPNLWEIPYTSGTDPAPLFAAVDAGGNPQPITSRPTAGLGPSGQGIFVYFGTGKYVEVGDKDVDFADPRPQTFYGIIDRNTNTNTDIVSGRSDLLEQSIILETVGGMDFEDLDEAGNVVGTETFNIRVTGAEAFLSSHRGWYIDLVSPHGYQGERQVSRSALRNGRVLFTTLIPSDDPCDPGGTGWLMALDALTGGRVEDIVFDLSGDDEFNDEDTVEITLPDGSNVFVPVSGKQSQVGIVPSPALLSNQELTHVYLPGTKGEIQEDTLSSGPADFGRQSWHQLR